MVKKALLIGCNYTGSSCPLRGCINDVKNIKAFLNKNGYEDSNITIMTDDLTSNNNLFPNKTNLLREINKLSTSAQDNDHLFLHYSGHGTQIVDKNNEEDDQEDEAICPSGFRSQDDFITDDTLNKILIAPIANNSTIHLTVILDCCHSGTALDLRYQYQCVRDISGSNQTRNLTKRSVPSSPVPVLTTIPDIYVVSSQQYYPIIRSIPLVSSGIVYPSVVYSDPDYVSPMVRYPDVPVYYDDSFRAYNQYYSHPTTYYSYPILSNGYKPNYTVQAPIIQPVKPSVVKPTVQSDNDLTNYINTLHVNKKEKEVLANVVLFSGCMDNQTSADSFEKNQNVGAMSNAFRNTFDASLSYQDFLKKIRGYMEGKYEQIPQMSFGKMVDPSSKVEF